MFQHENDAAARSAVINFRHRPARNDFAADTRHDFCIARLHRLPDRFVESDYDSVLRAYSLKGLRVAILE
jgi:hypothetical protein